MKDKMIIYEIMQHKEDVMFYVYDLMEYTFSLATCCISDKKEFRDLDLSKTFDTVDKILHKVTGVEKPKPDDVETRINQFVDTAKRDPRLQDILHDDLLTDSELLKLLKVLDEDDE